MPVELSRLICATPVSSTGLSAGVLTVRSWSSWDSDASENSGALLMMVMNALPSFTPVAAVGGPFFAPSTNVPAGDETDETRRPWKGPRRSGSALAG